MARQSSILKLKKIHKFNFTSPNASAWKAISPKCAPCELRPTHLVYFKLTDLQLSAIEDCLKAIYAAQLIVLNALKSRDWDKNNIENDFLETAENIVRDKFQQCDVLKNVQDSDAIKNVLLYVLSIEALQFSDVSKKDYRTIIKNELTKISIIENYPLGISFTDPIKAHLENYLTEKMKRPPRQHVDFIKMPFSAQLGRLMSNCCRFLGNLFNSDSLLQSAEEYKTSYQDKIMPREQKLGGHFDQHRQSTVRALTHLGLFGTSSKKVETEAGPAIPTTTAHGAETLPSPALSPQQLRRRVHFA